ncbi:MAG TPA: hypothetical protein VJT09_18580, partial [Pyrinomonadaceae bacterium]|nr:hypothetical protein [Pyrinomonadaceae bacterium]
MSANFMLAALLLGVSVSAQEAPSQDRRAPKPGDTLVFEREVAGPQGAGIRVQGGPGEDTAVFLLSEMSFDGRVVKGAPYSAQATTESTRTLSDGNRIKHKNSASIYRDSEGRTRRDQELGAVGPWAMSGDPQQTIFINDPVAGVNYVLDPRTRTARKMAPFRWRISGGEGSNSAPGGSAQGGAPNIQFKIERDVVTSSSPHPPMPDAGPQVQGIRLPSDPRNHKTESLGKQVIEGVEAEGSRTTITIPAGEIGNEQPIQIVWERWYSPELQAVVMSRHSDPMVGETVYKLTNITRGEPARSLFEVPGDYTV